MRTNVILAGKCHDHKSRHSAPSFRENVGSGENKSYQVLGIFISFSDREIGLPPGPLLFFDRNEARRAEKHFLETPPPLSEGHYYRVPGCLTFFYLYRVQLRVVYEQIP